MIKFTGPIAARSPSGYIRIMSMPLSSDPLMFDPADPFPLLPEGAVSYAEAQRHSEAVDAFLELRTEETESILKPDAANHPDHQLWIGLPVRSLLTPYTELRRLLVDLALDDGSRVIDLGAGYGRMAFVIGRHHPSIEFIGYEFVEARVRECQRCLQNFAYANVTMRTVDLSSPSFRPESAQVYFLYDYGTRDAIEKTLQDLREIASRQPIIVVGRGRASRDAIEREHPWLSQVQTPDHRAHYSIYRS